METILMRRFSLGFLALSALISCGGDHSEERTGDASAALVTTDDRLRISLAPENTPASLDALVLRVDAIRVHKTAGGGWITLREAPFEFDLLAYSTTRPAPLGNFDLAAGSYNQVRLIVSEVRAVINGVPKQVQCPSCATSGIKIMHPIVVGGTGGCPRMTSVGLVLDVGNSLTQLNKKLKLNPVVAVATGEDTDADGIPNRDDNCPDHANSNQADADCDGEGDACAPFQLLRLQPPPTPMTPAPTPNPSALPPGASASFPGHDGGSFMVRLQVVPSGPMAASTVFSDVMVPVLQAMGFTRLDEVDVPAGNGEVMPAGNLAMLVSAGPSERRPFWAAPEPTVSQFLMRAYGMNLAEFQDSIERVRIHYEFPQVVQTSTPAGLATVPIEHSRLLAIALDGQSVAAVFGNLLEKYAIMNSVVLDVAQAISLGQDSLESLTGVSNPLASPIPPPVLVLLPSGAGPMGEIGLRYAYRMMIGSPNATWLGWVDATTGNVVELDPLTDAVGGQARTWRRDPSTPTEVTTFATIDPAQNNVYKLQASGIWNAVDGPGANSAYTIADGPPYSTSSLANFDQPTDGLNDAAGAECNDDLSPALGADETFQQADVYATLATHREFAIGAGLIAPFPTPVQGGISLKVERPFPCGFDTCNACAEFSCNANLTRLEFGFCDAYNNNQMVLNCSNVGGFDPMKGYVPFWLNMAHDHTVVAHELGHLLNQHQYVKCAGGQPSVSFNPFHDLADAWSSTLEDTNCMGGWVAKNRVQANEVFYCQNPDKLSQSSGLPRVLHVDVPFDPAVTYTDHFPEHLPSGVPDFEYSDGQIAGTALWQVRQGMLSRCPGSGGVVYFFRFVQALSKVGYPGIDACNLNNKCARLLYRHLVELEHQMLLQWSMAQGAAPSPILVVASANKVTAGFAAIGIFDIPYQCLDDDPTTCDPFACPANVNGLCAQIGPDAVVDIDDGDPLDGFTNDLERGAYACGTGPSASLARSTYSCTPRSPA